MPQPDNGLLTDVIRFHEKALETLVRTINAENNYVPDWAKDRAHLDAAQHRTMLRSLYAMVEEVGPRPLWKHEKRGSIYAETGAAIVQCETPIEDGESLTLYRGMDGKWFVRRPDEFRDGRFSAMTAPAPGHSHAAALDDWLAKNGVTEATTLAALSRMEKHLNA